MSREQPPTRNPERIPKFLPQTQGIMRLYRGWDALEKHNGIDIIDFDLVYRVDSEPVQSREEVLDRLRSFHAGIVSRNRQEEFIKAKLNASIYYVRALMEEEIPYEEYVENITGIRPQLIPDADIARQKTRLDEAMTQVGYLPDRESFEEFSSRLRISRDDAEREARRCEETLIPIALQALDLEDVEFPHEIRFVEEEDYWMGWTSTTPEGLLLLRYNVHPLHTWYRGDMEFMTLHEVGGHFVQAGLLRRGIEIGDVNPIIGITTVQEPHTFVGEGTADALSYFLPEVEEAFSPEGILAREQRMLRDYVQNNAHIWVNQERDPEELVTYIKSYYPFSTDERVRLNLRNWRINPSRRAYQYVYGISRYYHRQFMEKLTPDKRKEYLRYAMAGYETPAQIMEYVDQLAAK